MAETVDTFKPSEIRWPTPPKASVWVLASSLTTRAVALIRRTVRRAYLRARLAESSVRIRWRIAHLNRLGQTKRWADHHLAFWHMMDLSNQRSRWYDELVGRKR